MDRLVRQKGAYCRDAMAPVFGRLAGHACWPVRMWLLQAAPDPDAGSRRDLSSLSLAQTALRGDKPSIRIEGDVQFAAEINWLVDNVKGMWRKIWLA